MRLSGWRSKAPGKEGLNQQVLDLVGSILIALGAELDPHCWVSWGDETGGRWTLMAPCPAGLATVNVRAGAPGEGSRASGRLIRWSKVQVGELAAESERGHRLVMFQIEGQPLRGTDDSADDVAAFAGLTLAGLEGRPLPNLDQTARRTAPSTAKAGAKARQAWRRSGRDGPARSGVEGAGRRRTGPLTSVTGATHRPSAVIFDLDGVLVDAEIWWDEVRRSWAAAHDRSWTPADLAAVMGANSLGWARIMRERLELDLPDQQIVDEIVAAMIERYERLGAPLIEGAYGAVRRLAAAGVPLGLASSAHRAVIDAALASLGIGDLLMAVVSSDDVAHGKPAPDVYLLAASRMGVDPASCLVIEDSLNGVLAGRAAGMTVALVPNASVPPADGAREAASVILGSLAELDPLLGLSAA